MNAITKTAPPVVGYTVPAAVGMTIDEIGTPALIVDLDAFEKNVQTMKAFIEAHGLRLRAHAKTHKSADIALYQIEHGGACGVCCQKVAEAEALVDAGVKDVLVSNEVVDPGKIDRLAAMAKKARVLVCVDDAGNVADLSAAATRHGVTLECLVEIDVGAGRCGVAPGAPAVALAQAIAAAPGLAFSGLQAYQGAAQHVHDFAERKAKIEAAIAKVRETVDLLTAAGLDCAIVGGAGTGTYYFEGASGVYNELQCGSYVFMDADYQRVLDPDGRVISEFENSLFILTSVMSHAKADKAICDAGLKAQSVDSGLPVIFGRDDVEYIKCSDEHGVISDPQGVLKLNEKLKLVPGHCDPTCNVYDWYVAVRGGVVEAVWPVTARGLAL
ncbi:DSD1 family PLP-dependent enzyme [Roseospira goensis]|uniref:3-hydroxy-D-aspartate aldolase n=1 Tax=Roseospira goensis TaxID=391922 RepID=A0A7W6S0T2_9PROT|nr:DSD1 family PLP-dependent enzyme [Roseospira goensis]MBB4286778.1 3-hydroxy-D-aspartate aldolase [Roseospira goensis]